MAARWAKKRDANEPAIVEALRAAGCHIIQADHPDLIVGYRGHTFLFEVKSPKTGRLTKSQRELFKHWTGDHLSVVYNAEMALETIRRITMERAGWHRG